MWFRRRISWPALVTSYLFQRKIKCLPHYFPHEVAVEITPVLIGAQKNSWVSVSTLDIPTIRHTAVQALGVPTLGKSLCVPVNSIAYETCKQSVHPYNFVHFLGVWLARRDRRSGDWSGSRNLEKRIRPRAVVYRDSKPRVSVPKLVYLVPCCTENLFFPSLSPSSLLIPLPPLLYHAFLLLLYLPLF